MSADNLELEGPRQLKYPDFRLLPRLAFTAVVTLAAMTAYETLKQYLAPDISLWQSHAVTIVFTTSLATAAAYLVAQKLARSNLVVMQLNRALQAEKRRMILHSQMTGFLQSCQRPEEACRVIRDFALRMFPEDAGCILMISESKNLVEGVASWGEPLAEARVFTPEECWALRRGQPYLVESASGMLCDHLRATALFPRICIPLTAQGETFGVLHFESSPVNRDGDYISVESKRRLWTAMAEHVSLALGNLKLREKLRNQSIRDALTGLFNRRYMEESLERELRRALRHHRPLAVMMLDVDNFKEFNDQFGHAAGDAVLQALGKHLRTGIRREDIPCRYGGEEFAIILADASLANARQRAEELRESLKHVKADATYVAGTVTVSLGVASYPEHGSTPEALLRAADSALYLAKKAGRDRVAVFSPSEANGEPSDVAITGVGSSTGQAAE